jgi:hypothetical protein
MEQKNRTLACDWTPKRPFFKAASPGRLLLQGKAKRAF